MSVNCSSALLNRFRTVMVNVRPHKGIQRPLVMVYCNSACHGELVSGLGEYLTPIDSPVIQNAYRCPKRYCNALEDGIMMLVIDDKVPDGEVLAGVRDIGVDKLMDSTIPWIMDIDPAVRLEIAAWRPTVDNIRTHSVTLVGKDV